MRISPRTVITARNDRLLSPKQAVMPSPTMIAPPMAGPTICARLN